MSKDTLQAVAQALVAPKKGILAADESTGTIQKRFDKIGVENNEKNRQAYRELLFTAPGVSKYLSGVILYDETLRQSTVSGEKFVKVLNDQGIIPGIKVDLGTTNFKNSAVEKTTKGLDGLAERLSEYYELGARFAKWRAVYTISDTLPSPELIEQNAKDLAAYAKLCQEAQIVPIVEPEVLMDGSHSIARCYEVTYAVLTAVFAELKKQGVDLTGMLLKPNMVIPGEDATDQATATEIAAATIDCFRKSVPPEVPGIVFLSGGQSEDQACETLNAIQIAKGNSPWELSYSYGRALQASTLKAWSGDPKNFAAAQAVFLKRCLLASNARSGNYTR